MQRCPKTFPQKFVKHSQTSAKPLSKIASIYRKQSKFGIRWHILWHHPMVTFCLFVGVLFSIYTTTTWYLHILTIRNSHTAQCMIYIILSPLVWWFHTLLLFLNNNRLGIVAQCKILCVRVRARAVKYNKGHFTSH
jgi:hypothetical protein